MLRWVIGLVVFSGFWAPLWAAEDLSKLLNQQRFVRTDGKEGTLPGLANGSPMVVLVLKSSDCPVCLRQVQSLVDRQLEFARLGVQVGIVAHSDTATLAAFKKRYQIPFPVLHESRPGLLKALGYWRSAGLLMPGYFLLDACGRIALTSFGRRMGGLEDELIFKALEGIRQHASECLPSS
jgi:peroxiredoxin